jgi:hypothetical protein
VGIRPTHPSFSLARKTNVIVFRRIIVSKRLSKDQFIEKLKKAPGWFIHNEQSNGVSLLVRDGDRMLKYFAPDKETMDDVEWKDFIRQVVNVMQSDEVSKRRIALCRSLNPSRRNSGTNSSRPSMT